MDGQLEKVLRSAGAELQQGQPERQRAELQRRLLESVFRGCDLVQQPGLGHTDPLPPSPPPSPPAQFAEHPSRRHFHNNAYLDQVLSWAYTQDSES